MINDRREQTPEAGEIQRSLRACWMEGVAAQMMMGILDYYLIPYALFLGASNQQIGWFVAIPNLLSSLSQLVAVRAIDVAGSRKRLMVTGAAIHIAVLATMAALAFIPVGKKIIALTILMSLFRLIGSLFGPAWGSLVSEYLPEDRRGKYFGFRSRIVGVAGVISIAFWGAVLDLLKKTSGPLIGFTILISAATVYRALSTWMLSRMTDLPVRKTPDAEFTLWMFLRRFKESNFVKFIFYVSAITFATQLCAPYFSVYMLKSLNFSYLAYTSVQLSSVLIGFVAFPIWGKHADVVGNAKILKLTSMVIPLVSFGWAFARLPYQLVIIEMFSGFVWGGFNLCATNFIYDAVVPEKRVRCLSYFNLINGAAGFAGNSLGGFLADRLPPFFGSSLCTLFLISTAARFAGDFFLARNFREVRSSAKSVSSMDLFFSVVGFRPMIGRNGEFNGLTLRQRESFRRRTGDDRRQQSRVA